MLRVDDFIHSPTGSRCRRWQKRSQIVKGLKEVIIAQVFGFGSSILGSQKSARSQVPNQVLILSVSEAMQLWGLYKIGICNRWHLKPMPAKLFNDWDIKHLPLLLRLGFPYMVDLQNLMMFLLNYQLPVSITKNESVARPWNLYFFEKTTFFRSQHR